MDRKAIEITFNWIFVLIAGAAILIFFVVFINKQIESSGEGTGSKLQLLMESIFAAVAQNPDSVQIHKAVDFEMVFKCDESGHTFRTRDSMFTSSLDTEAIMSPAVIGDSELVTWSTTFNAPYPVSTLLLLSDKKTEYVFVGLQTGAVRSLYEALPSNFSKRFIILDELKEFRDDGHRRYIFISDAGFQNEIRLHSDIAQQLKAKSSILLLEQSTSHDYVSYGRMHFYEDAYDSTPQVVLPYVGKEMLFGAIVSGDAGLYTCAVDKLMDKSMIVNKMNLVRIAQLREEYDASSRCYVLFDPDDFVSQDIAEMSASASDFMNRASEYADKLDEIRVFNNQLLRDSCPQVY